MEPLPQRVPTASGQAVRSHGAGAGRARRTPNALRRRDRLCALRNDHALPATGRQRFGRGADRHPRRDRSHGVVARVRGRGRAAGLACRRHLERDRGRHQRHGHLSGCCEPGVRTPGRPLFHAVHPAHLFGGAGVRSRRRHRRRARRQQPFQPDAAAPAGAARDDGADDRKPAHRSALSHRAPFAFSQPSGVCLHAARRQAGSGRRWPHPGRKSQRAVSARRAVDGRNPHAPHRRPFPDLAGRHAAAQRVVVVPSGRDLPGQRGAALLCASLRWHAGRRQMPTRPQEHRLRTALLWRRHLTWRHH